MSDTIRVMRGENRFKTAYKHGRQLVSIFARLFLGDRTILSLHEFTQIVKPENESFSGSREIEISRIVGSENRSEDFAEGFLPVKLWMENRWTTVLNLMKESKLEDAIDVLEYGGFFFVRDGNHRVSAAKNLKREFIRANVTKLEIPFRLSEQITRADLKHFEKMKEFNIKTRFYSNIPNPEFDIRRIKTWQIMEKEMNCWSPSWFDRHKEEIRIDREEDMQTIWYEKLYRFISNYVTKNSLHYLFPGWGTSDVVLELIRIWNSFNDPDKYSLEDIYRIFIRRKRRARFFLVPFQWIFEKINMLTRTACDERRLFLERSCIKDVRSGFRVPADLGKKYWRKLYRELFIIHAQKLKRKLGRVPYQYELVKDWYDNVWLPKTEL